jgi:hypothetical protein
VKKIARHVATPHSMKGDCNCSHDQNVTEQVSFRAVAADAADAAAAVSSLGAAAVSVGRSAAVPLSLSIHLGLCTVT